jgi:hypothetical protein
MGGAKRYPTISGRVAIMMGIASLHPSYDFPTKNPTPIATTLSIIAAVDSQPSQ